MVATKRMGLRTTEYPYRNGLKRLHCKKKGILPNPQKRFGGFEKACKCVQNSKKRIKKSTKPLRDLPVYPGEDPFFLETF
jgi:hypothetical protein